MCVDVSFEIGATNVNTPLGNLRTHYDMQVLVPASGYKR